jgi:hypothetical protein
MAFYIFAEQSWNECGARINLDIAITACCKSATAKLWGKQKRRLKKKKRQSGTFGVLFFAFRSAEFYLIFSSKHF